MTDKELGYVAGIIDGEGTISVYTPSSRNIRGQPTISVTQKDKRLIDYLIPLLPGWHYHKRTRDNCHTLYTTRSTIIYPFLKYIRPLLIVKGEDADYVLQHIEGMPKFKKPSDAT